MRLRGWLCMGLCCTLAGPAMVLGQDPAPAKKAFTPAPIAPADSMNALLSLLESEVVGAAEAMPAEKYDFAPSTTIGLYTGVRSFGAQVKHLAESNYEFFDGWGIPGAADSKTIEALKSKDDIVKALKDSYVYAHAAVSTITNDNAFMSVPGPAKWKLTRASMATFALAHSMDHYGQMVEYLRMNGIVPPASRQQGSM